MRSTARYTPTEHMNMTGQDLTGPHTHNIHVLGTRVCLRRCTWLHLADEVRPRATPLLPLAADFRSRGVKPDKATEAMLARSASELERVRYERSHDALPPLTRCACPRTPALARNTPALARNTPALARRPPNGRCAFPQARRVVRGAWCVVRGAWRVVRGAWCVVRGAWCVVQVRSSVLHGLLTQEGHAVVRNSSRRLHDAWSLFHKWQAARVATVVHLNLMLAHAYAPSRPVPSRLQMP
jgi:hypothetical protein